MNHWEAALERMNAYEERMNPAHLGTTGRGFTSRRGVEADVENAGIEQMLDRVLTGEGLKFYYHISRSH